MNIKEFAEQIREEILELLPGIKEITVKEILKNNSVRYIGLVFQAEGSNMSPTIYLESFYERFQKENANIAQIADEIINLYYEAYVEESLDLGFMMDWEKAQKMVLYKLVNREMNEELLTQLPHQDFFDLAMIFYLHVERMNGDIVIRNEHMDHWGVQLEDIAKVAKENTPTLCPGQLKTMGEVLAELFDNEEMDLGNCMYVLSNERKVNGAGTLLYPNMMEQIGTRLDSDYYVLPSSIHELIIIPDNDEVSEEKLVGMVREVNETAVSEDEVLGNNIYFYGRTEKQLRMVS